MDTKVFVEGIDLLRPLFNPQTQGSMRPRDIVGVLQRSMGFLVTIGNIARQYPMLETSSFILDVLFTCEGVIGMLPLASRLSEFQSWELQLNEYTGVLVCLLLSGQRNTLPADVPFPSKVQQAMGAPTGHKRKAEEEEPEGEESADEDDSKVTAAKKAGSSASAETSSQKPANRKGRATPATVTPKSAPAAPSMSGVKKESPQTKRIQWDVHRKFKSTGPTTGATVVVDVSRDPPRKSTKTQPGSVKDEPGTVVSGSKLQDTRVQTRSQGKGRAAEATSASVPKGEHEPYPIKVKQKTFTAYSTYSYEDKLAEPVKPEEVKAVLKALTKPKYGCAQCSSSIQNQDCIFLGWGQRCNNCEAATKSLCSFRAEPSQRYDACRELAKYIKATPENLRASIQRSTAALQIFEQSANAAALAARSFRISMEETLHIWGDAVANEGEEALTGIVVEDPGFTAQIREVLNGMGASSRIPSAIYSPVIAFRPAPMSDLPSSQDVVDGYSNAKPVHPVEEVEPNEETKPVEDTNPIDMVQPSSSEEAPPIPLPSHTSPVPMQEPPVSPPAIETADRPSDFMDATGPSVGTGRDSAERDASPCDGDFDSYEGSVVMGTPGADPDEDLLPPVSHSQVEREEHSRRLNSFMDTDDESPKRPPRKPKKASSCRRHSSGSVHSFRKTLARDDVV
ncbi:hypothetical protein ARMSODRAFT_1020633 [Armillaria solidipes]|uniref:Uncharacterized protein n=1 Tax=Armillaria solidipes TaxID=1076256 RepID=A0A2H3BRD6_9AGAR|nr:hypothetical protein ARMSODRAFT_1020633 [Armillaria solidipes]